MTMKRWLRVMMAGVVVSACGGPLEPGESPEGPAADRQAYTTSSTTPPPVVELTSRTDMKALWPSTSSVRRYVVLVAYTQQRDASGNVPPPRFRAFGIDLSTRSYLFTADGDRASFLGSFTAAMLDRGVILISTPAGFEYAGDCGTTNAMALAQAHADGRSAQETLTDTTIACATDPIEGSTSTGSQGDEWKFDWMKFLEIPTALNNGLPDGHFDALLANPK